MAEENTGFMQDGVTRIINVHWADGLAVEFFDKDGPAATPLKPEPPFRSPQLKRPRPR